MSALEAFKYLNVPLPETVNSYKYTGDFDSEIRAVDAYLLRDDIPLAMRKRLELEKIIASRMKYEFSVTEDEAFLWFCENYDGFDREKFNEMMDNGMLEWRFVKGERRLSDSFRSSVSRKQTELYISRKDKTPYIQSEKVRLIHSAIGEMKALGCAKRRIRIRQELKINKLSERVGEIITVHLPIPAECPEQSDVKVLSASHPYTVGNSGQKTILIKTELKEDEVFFVDYEYTLCIKYNALDFDAPSSVNEEYLKAFGGEQEPHIIFTPLIRETAREIIGNETDPLKKAKKIYDYITKYLRYSYMREYLVMDNIPEFALTSTIGDCGVMALLFITLCRASGIPAGWQSGLSVYPFRASSHDWAVFYVEPYGKLYADLSGGEDACEKEDAVRHSHYFGNIDPYRMIANNEFFAEFATPCMFCRTDPYDNQSGEAEYTDRALTCDELVRNKKLLKFDKF